MGVLSVRFMESDNEKPAATIRFFFGVFFPCTEGFADSLDNCQRKLTSSLDFLLAGFELRPYCAAAKGKRCFVKFYSSVLRFTG